MNKTSFLLLVFCLIFTACRDSLVQTIDLDEVDFEKQLAVSGTLNSSSDELRLLISENQPVTDPPYRWDPVRDARVALFQDETLIGNPSNDFSRYYYLDLENIQIGPGNYRLEVEHSSLGKAVVQTEIPEEIKIDDIQFVEDYGIAPNSFSISDAVLITFTDPPEDNYYGVSFDLRVEDVIYDTTINNLDTIIGKFYPYVQIDSAEPGCLVLNDGIVFSDALFNGNEHTVAVFLKDYNDVVDIAEKLEDLYVTWDVISKDKHDFLSSLELYESSQNFGPFSEAVSIYNNVEGGLGIFSGVNRSYYPIP